MQPGNWPHIGVTPVVHPSYPTGQITELDEANRQSLRFRVVLDSEPQPADVVFVETRLQIQWILLTVETRVNAEHDGVATWIGVNLWIN